MLGVHLGSGNGIFAKATHYMMPGRAFAVAAADVDVKRDGVTDLLVAVVPSLVQPLAGNAVKRDGTFMAMPALVVGQDPRAVIATDLDRDGLLDVVTANYNGGKAGSLSVLSNKGGFANSTSLKTGGDGTRDVAVADLDGDGAPDLASANDAGTVTVFLARNGGT